MIQPALDIILSMCMLVKTKGGDASMSWQELFLSPPIGGAAMSPSEENCAMMESSTTKMAPVHSILWKCLTLKMMMATLIFMFLVRKK